MAHDQAHVNDLCVARDVCVVILFLMTQRMERGRRGEDHACVYLLKKGFSIIERNHREKCGELDIIARARDKTLVFVEVKTMREGSANDLLPEDQMSDAKMKKFRRVAELYANMHSELLNERCGWRLDVLAIIEDGGLYNVRHYEGV